MSMISNATKSAFTSKRIHRRVSAFLALLLIATVLLDPFSYSFRNGAGEQSGLFGANSASAAALPTSTNQATPLPPAPTGSPVAVVPTPDPDTRTPYLVVDTRVAPGTLAVGDMFTATIAVHNESRNQAANLSISLPLPAGVERASAPSAGGSSGSGDISWQQATLAANSGFTATAALRLTAPQAGDAVLLKPQVSGSNLPTDVVDVAGAIVVPANEAPTSASFRPGSQATLRSADNRVTVTLPGNASASALTLSHDKKPKAGSKDEEKAAKKEKQAGKKNGLPTFYLNAKDAAGKEVHQFSAPLTIKVSYTPQQLQALGISEGDLTLFWFDADNADNKDAKNEDGTPAGKWVSIDTDIDTRTRTATAKVDHFSAFKLGDGSSPSDAFIPSLQGWQVSLYTGAASYQYPIEVPAGPGGVKPSVSLSYSSGSSDGGGGEREKQQTGWVGKDWSLNSGYIALNRRGSDRAAARYYTLVLNGRSYDLVRGDPRVGFRGNAFGEPTASVNDPTNWEWKTPDESFMRVRAERNGRSTGSEGQVGRGGFLASGTADTSRYWRHKWQVWTPDGTRYDFEEDAWQGFGTRDASNSCVAGENFMEAYKWHLTRVEDTHQNQITYNYARESGWADTYCFWVRGTVDWAVWPTEITWGKNVAPGSTATIDRYRVQFVSASRSDYGVDTQYDGASNQLGAPPHEKRRLNVIKVHSMRAAAWELVREYRLCYAGMAAPCPSASNLLSDDSMENGNGTYSANAGYPKITLTGIQQVGSDGETANPPTALPLTTFAYGTNENDNNDRGTGYYPKGDWNRLTHVNNGRGGTITFNYENIGAATNIGLLRNYRRVTSKVVSDGRGNSYTWNYAYTDPAMNTIGAIVDAGHGPNQYPNSATVWFTRFYPESSDNLIHKPKTEFRGHGKVVERDPNGNETEHFFYQGDAGCAPSASTSGNAITNDACFQQMRNREFLKGREYQTVTHQGLATDPKLSEVLHTFSVSFLSDGADAYADDRFTGLWRAYSNESETIEKTWEGTSTPISKRTTYSYDANTGNLLSTTEYDATGAAYRTTEHSYKTLNTATSYILDRKRKDTVRQGGTTGPLLAHTIYGWDGSLGGPEALTKGELTLARKYYNLTVPPSTSFPATGLSTDTSYTYDVYGNQKTVTTYSGYGQTTGMNTTPSYGAAGGGGSNTARTTTTDYDTTFNALPKKVTPPLAALSETANYDAYGMRMGLLTSITDLNGQTTSAEYDAFGRQRKLIKPGDTSTSPSVKMTYDDTAVPFRYIVEPKDNTGSRPTIKFYDGIGREIQTKSESLDGLRHIVVDKQHDGVGQVLKQSTPREVSNPSYGDAQFWGYTAPDASVLWTTTQYDALGRATRVTSPDSTYTEMSYGVRGNQHKTVTIDAKRHKKAHYSDVFGRLVEVGDYVNEGDANAYSTTTYGYSPLDLLTSVLDANGKSTTVNYDSLGRKTSMSDPSMGTWSYVYHANGALQRQNDAKWQWIEFDYDTLDRLWQKRYSDSTRVQYWYDGSVSGYYNAGQRTTMARYAANGHEVAAAWFNYNARGRQAKVDYRTGQLSATLRTFTWAYDSADRVTNMTYPTGEAVTYTYDAAWRQTSVCGTTCYASGAQYTALDQPKSFTLGNGLVQGYEYEGVMQRLWKLKVGTTANPTSISNRTYGYDAVGNVQDLNSTTTGENQHFTYDHLDRLNGWTVTNASNGSLTVSQAYTYDKLGNILTKGGTAAPTTYNYNLSATTNGGPYALRSLNGGTQFAYDANGNMTSSPATPFGDPARTLSWNVENLPVSITSGAVTESYTYDAAGERASRSVTQNSVTTSTYYFGGMYEVDQPSGNTRSLYTLNGQVVAQKEFVPAPPTPTNTPTPTSTPTPVPNNAQAVLVYFPGGNTVVVGQQFQVEITMKNTGSNTWSASTSHRLGSQNPTNNVTWGTDRLQLPAGVTVAPGQSYTWSVYLTAPSTAGTYNFQWRMVQEWIEWFGELTPNRTVNVIAHCTTCDEIDPCAANPANCADSLPDYGGAELSLQSPTPTGEGEGKRVGEVSAEGDSTDAVGAESKRGLGNMIGLPMPTLTSSNASSLSTVPAVSTTATATGVTAVTASPTAVSHAESTGSIDSTGTKRGSYSILQSSGTETIVYMHSDHLGSVSTVTNQSGAVVSSQQFDPWGKVRSGGISVTKLNYTGQKKDDTGLLYYHARHYDPGIARFVSADSIVPGAASGVGGAGGTVGAWQNSGLTVDYHESTFVTSLAAENAELLKEGFFRNSGKGAGPSNPQALNRYNYVLNNPLRYVDPTGHNADDQCMGCPPAKSNNKPPPSPAPTPTPSGTPPPPGAATPTPTRRYSETELYALALFAAEIFSYVVASVAEEFLEDALFKYGTNIDDWEMVGWKSDDLKDPNHTGIARIYALFRDKTTGSYYQVSLDADIVDGGIKYSGEHFSHWGRGGDDRYQGWQGSGPPPGWKMDEMNEFWHKRYR
ncbi:MAG: NBR1-Ig-like domain-containing protein [Chloroflexota bacterium]|nr:NBR1-Ig-like domain-containing protein [Chloroflexota bacterium]